MKNNLKFIARVILCAVAVHVLSASAASVVPELAEVVSACAARGEKTYTVTGTHEIKRTINLPSDFTLVLDGARLTMAEGTFCNMFRADGVTNVTLVGRNGAVLSGGVYNGLSERNAGKEGRPKIWVNNLILFTNVEGFRIEDLRLEDQRWWAINCVACGKGTLRNLDFRANPTAILPDGTVTNVLKRREYANILVKNADGIDLRWGCHDILIENIMGFTEDDSVALTCLGGGFERDFVRPGTPCAIRDVVIRNVKTASICSNVRLLAQGGGSLKRILIEDLEDVSASCPYMEGPGEFAVNLGSDHLYRAPQCRAEDMDEITIRNVKSRPGHGVSQHGPRGKVVVSEQTTSSSATDLAKVDSNFSAPTATATNGVRWIDGADLPLEGRGFGEGASRYMRLPRSAEGVVPGDLWWLARHTASFAFRFKTDSKNLRITWAVTDNALSWANMSPTGKSGIDVYERTPDGWHHVATGLVREMTNTLTCAWTPGREALVYLPNYNGIASFKLGIDTTAAIAAPGPRTSGVTKPVVIYGSSITQGASASRAGLSFVNIAGRLVDVEMVNLGFSGRGKMEPEVGRVISEIDAACFVIDSAWNITSQQVAKRWEPFVRNLRAAHPDTPIIFMEPCHESHQADKARASQIIRDCYAKLRKEDPGKWTRLYLLSADEQLPADDETTVEGVHPNDWGMMHIGRTLAAKLREALALSAPSAGFGLSVTDFGAKGDGVTDDTAAIQRAIDALDARGGGKLYFPYTPKGYLLASPAREFAVNGRLVRAQLVLPPGNANIQFEGEMPCKHLYPYMVRPKGCERNGFRPTCFGILGMPNTCLHSTWDAPAVTNAAERPWAVLAAPEGDSCSGKFSRMMFAMKNLEIRVHLDHERMYPTTSAAFLKNVSRLMIEDCQFCLDDTVGDTNLGKSLQPNPCHTVGLHASGDQNDEQILRNVAVQGFRYGFVFGEHVSADYLYCHNNEEAIVFHDSTHLSTIDHVVAQHNRVILSTSRGRLFGNKPAPVNVIVRAVNFEGGQTVADPPEVSKLVWGVFDPDNRLRGSLVWHESWGKGVFPIEGAKNFKINHFPEQ